MHLLALVPQGMEAAVLKAQPEARDEIAQGFWTPRFRPGPAIATTRAAVCTAMPPMSSRFNPISPV